MSRNLFDLMISRRRLANRSLSIFIYLVGSHDQLARLAANASTGVC
ncbi:unnamed protein product [Acidithrix sp. C25]|nr:unnamed protein product [Acidithrix sp. C25]